METTKRIEFVIERKIDQHGRLSIPPIYRNMLGVQSGDTFACRILDNGDIVLTHVKEPKKE